MEPLTPPCPADVQAVLDRLPGDWLPPFLHYRILARGSRLLAAYLQGFAYLNPSHITTRQREVFLLRVIGRCRNALEWCLRVHYFATSSGMSEAEIQASVQGDARAAIWTPNDRLLIRLADELHDTASISDDLWANLRLDFTEEALLQLVLMAGHYRTNAYPTAGLSRRSTHGSVAPSLVPRVLVMLPPGQRVLKEASDGKEANTGESVCEAATLTMLASLRTSTEMPKSTPARWKAPM